VLNNIIRWKLSIYHKDELYAASPQPLSHIAYTDVPYFTKRQIRKLSTFLEIDRANSAVPVPVSGSSILHLCIPLLTL